MIIYALPCSGPRFSSQLGLIAELSEIDVKPDIVVGTSGGNVAAYVGLASDWSPHGILRIGRQICSEVFVRSWWPGYFHWIPSWLYGVTQGAFYDHAGKGHEMFHRLFDKDSITRTEIWSGTLNVTTGKSEFFCNRSAEKSILDSSMFREDLFSSRPLNYLNGDIDSLAQIATASAAVPVIVPPVSYNDNFYTDGGSRLASPLSPFLHMFQQFPGFHINYINCRDVQYVTEDTDNYIGLGNILSIGNNRVSDIITGNMVLERSAAIQSVGDHTYHEFLGTRENMIEIEAMRQTRARSLLEIYPTTSNKLDLTTFTGEDVAEQYYVARKNYKCRLWLGKQNAVSKSS